MKEIRFTLGDTDIWHTIYADIEIKSEIQVETIVANIIGSELSKKVNNKGHQKFVKLLDENGNIIGESSDICEIGLFEFKK